VNISTRLPCPFLDRAVNGGEEGQVGGVASEMSRAETRNALAWWLEAGVDAAIQEKPRDWLAPAPPRRAAISEAPAETNLLVPSQDTLTELQQWLASSVQLPLAGRSANRALPHGPEEAPIMLLTDAPTVEDAAAGQPISGESWALAQKMLAAIGLASEQAYSASLSCFSAPGMKMSEKERAACAEIARRHIRLARPKRLLLLGDGPCVALLGKPLPKARGHVHKIEGVRAVATFHPRALINQPSNKSRAWQDLLLLMEDES
jgi:DNA polymerase